MMSRPLCPPIKLLPLTPEGVGTADVERPTSYVIRLADSHAVPIRYLVSDEIYSAPEGTQNAHWSNWLSQGFTIDGFGVETSRLLEILEVKTGRSDLRTLAFEPYQKLVSQRNLLRTSSAWCNSCIANMLEEGRPVYGKLMWAFKSVSCCPKHSEPLEIDCPSCGVRQPVLAARTLPGRCFRCFKMLHLLRQSDISNTTFDLWAAQTVGQMVAALPRVDGSQLVTRFRDAIRVRSCELTGGSVRELSRRSSVNYGVLLNSLRSGTPIQLKVLLQSLHNLQIPVESLLGEPVPAYGAADSLQLKVTIPRYTTDLRRELMKSELTKQAPRSPGKLADDLGEFGTVQLWRADRDLYSQLRRAASVGSGTKHPIREAKEIAKKALEHQLGQEEPSPVRQVAQDLGYRSDSCLRSWEPEMCKALTAKCGELASARMREALMRAMAEAPPPRLAQVAKDSGFSVAALSRKAPGMCTELARQRKEFFRQADDELRRLMLPFLSGSPPLNGTSVAECIGVPATQLRRRVPDLWKEILIRCRDYKQLQKQAALNTLFADVHYAVEQLLACGEYPSAGRVESLLKPKGYEWRRLNEARKEALLTLGVGFEESLPRRPSETVAKARSASLS